MVLVNYVNCFVIMLLVCFGFDTCLAFGCRLIVYLCWLFDWCSAVDGFWFGNCLILSLSLLCSFCV